MSLVVNPTGSWDVRRRTTISLPEPVLNYLRVKSIIERRSLQDLVLDAVVDHFGISQKNDSKI
jgi:hypothetical protein